MVSERLLKKQKKRLRIVVQRFEDDLDDIISSEQEKVGRSKTKAALLTLLAVNMFLRDDNREAVSNLLSHVTDAFRGGINYAPGKNSTTLMSHDDIIQQGVMEFVTKLGDDVIENLTSIVQEGFSNGQSIADISTTLQERLDIDRVRANAIARTEVMRANNAGGYLQAKDQDYQYWVADMRDEACDICQDEFQDQVFTIDQTGRLPPIHPNCACIVEYFMTEEEAQGWASEIASDQNNLTDKQEEDQQENGQGAWVAEEKE